ncbi:hypothetical protein DFP74_2500 [Nocardiopsis sp. Huas11]|uniref:hypothetical protein n=1 Tax=Nocardiopsis sp. Huas11 TaxID=2183912 RepID=UPI000EAE61A9|nr:hypothetical protein [Nocardiopsis sp. Huas11]RKS06851.1 hypothetical protein DFP74_2500 [Nocardiopsis sp. Huas11]
MVQESDTRDTEAAACAAIEEFLAGRLERTLSVYRKARQADGAERGAGEAMAELHAEDLSAWQQYGYLSHANAAAVIDVFYERRVAQAARALRQAPRNTARRDRCRARYHSLRHEKAAVEAWLAAQGWDLELRATDHETERGVAGHCWTTAGR